MPDKILIIDDEPNSVAGLAMRLRAAGYEVITSPDGISGLAAARTDRPDVILVDYSMPDIDGIEVIRRLKSDPELAGMPVILLSAVAKDHIRQAAVAAGATCFLSKLGDSESLIAAIEAAIAGDEHDRR